RLGSAAQLKTMKQVCGSSKQELAQLRLLEVDNRVVVPPKSHLRIAGPPPSTNNRSFLRFRYEVSFDALDKVPQASGLAIPDGQVRQANHACCVKPSLNGNENSTASNYLNLRRIREQRLLSAAVAARILKLSASANHTVFSRPNTRTYYTKKERQVLSLKLDYPSDSSPAELTSRSRRKEKAIDDNEKRRRIWVDGRNGWPKGIMPWSG
nr:ATP synthase alpha subunit, mitochondrial [Tanacetum cinerariifolium]